VGPSPPHRASNTHRAAPPDRPRLSWPPSRSPRSPEGPAAGRRALHGISLISRRHRGSSSSNSAAARAFGEYRSCRRRWGRGRGERKPTAVAILHGQARARRSDCRHRRHRLGWPMTRSANRFRAQAISWRSAGQQPCIGMPVQRATTSRCRRSSHLLTQQGLRRPAGRLKHRLRGRGALLHAHASGRLQAGAASSDPIDARFADRVARSSSCGAGRALGRAPARPATRCSSAAGLRARRPLLLALAPLGHRCGLRTPAGPVRPGATRLRPFPPHLGWKLTSMRSWAAASSIKVDRLVGAGSRVRAISDRPAGSPPPEEPQSVHG